jgi:hypothetical protein
MLKRDFEADHPANSAHFMVRQGVLGRSLRLDRWLTFFPGAPTSCDEIVSFAPLHRRSGTGERVSGCKDDGNKPEVSILRGHHDRHPSAKVQTRLLMPADDVPSDS